MTARNYSNKGGDNDRVLSPNISNINTALMDDIIYLAETNITALVNNLRREIRIQAKNKTGEDLSDIYGIEQLIKMPGYENVVNILISTVSDFMQETKDEARKHNIILINGLKFAALLVKYGFDAF